MAKHKSPSRGALPPHYQSLLFLLESCSSISQALQIQSQLFVSGLHRQRLFLSKLISFFSLSSLPHSLLIFSHLRRPNAFIYNTLIRAHSRSPDPSASLNLYKSLLSSARTPRPNNHTFPFLLRSCARLPCPDTGLQVHCHVKKLGLDLDVHVRNSLIVFYCRLGELDVARELFDEITQLVKDPVSFNVMMRGYAKWDRAGDALRIFEEMVGSDVGPDRHTFVCLMSVCKVLGDLRSGKAVHVLSLRRVGFDVDDRSRERLKLGLVDMYVKLGAMGMAERVFGVMGDGKSLAAWSCMVSGYAKCGRVEIARKLFDEMPEKDLISWTSMISGYSQNGRYKEALVLYEEMEKEGVKPDEVTLVAVLSACAHLHKLDLGKRLHLYIENSFLSRNNSNLCTAIVDMYAKCGCIETAQEIFDQVDKKSKTKSLFNSMISGLAQCGCGKRAIALLGEMEILGLRPDEVTFVGVLCACSHSGMTEEGKEIFESMVNRYGIHPQVEHYGCMVDLLGRGGYLDEAYEFIKNMPISPNSVIWSALLHNCRVHKKANLGKIAERGLLQLGAADSEPKGRSSRLSDMFSNVTSPEKAKKARKKNVLKQRGWSYIKWHGSLYHFLEDDTSHPQSKEINLMLEEMTRRLKLASHDSELLLDVDKEKKGDVVSHHSERIAFAFGLINTQPGDTITITMDLQMCWDCHSSFMLFSKIFSRIVVVRDKVRVHRMKNRSCSCKNMGCS